MTETTYLIVMVTIILAITAVSVPWLFRKRCPECGAWTGLSSKNCRNCPYVFPEDTP